MATTASSVTSGGVLTIASSANLMVGQTVQLTGTPFGGLLADTTYYILAVGATTITLSLTRAGSAISIAGGSGVMVVTPGPRLGKGIGNIISAGSDQDFNNMQAIVAKVMGPPTDGDPQYGYNQLVSSAQVAVGNKVTLSQWALLRDDMIKARGHQTGSASEFNNITLPTTTSKITEALRLQYWNYALVIDQYKTEVGPGQYTPVTANTASRIDDWNNNIYSEVTLTFGDVATARAFFNAGGNIKISVQLSGPFSSASTSKSNTFATMFAQMGTITLERNATTIAPGSSGTTSSIGYFQLTSSNQQIFRKAAPSGAYTPNEFIINARTSGSSVILTMYYNDNDTGTLRPDGSSRGANQWTDPVTGQVVSGNIDEYVQGTLLQTVALSRPSGSYVSIPNPSVSLAGNLSNTTSPEFGMLASSYIINEGDTVDVTLKTQNVPDGSSFAYTVTGVSGDRFTSGSLTGSFVVYNNSGSQSWTVDNNLRNDAQQIMTVALNNGQANTVITINDTSRNPLGSQLFTGIGPGQAWVCPAGVRNVSVLIVAGGAGGQSKAGGGGGGGQVRVHQAATSPGSTYYITVGGGGGAGSSGGNSDWNGATAIGGTVGTSGTSSGNAGPHSGGYGGSCPQGGGGGAPSGNTSTTMQAGGGGGGGAGSGGGAAPQAYQGGDGGAGLAVTWFNNSTVYLAGGGGGGGTNYGGGGSYGGGNGASGNNTGSNGQAGTGGGGGGGGAYASAAGVSGVLTGAAGGSGGSGLVWIKWS